MGWGLGLGLLGVGAFRIFRAFRDVGFLGLRSVGCF